MLFAAGIIFSAGLEDDGGFSIRRGVAAAVKNLRLLGLPLLFCAFCQYALDREPTLGILFQMTGTLLLYLLIPIMAAHPGRKIADLFLT